MPEIKCCQGEAQWIIERVGRVTASRVADIVSKTKAGKYTAAREKYMMELLIEVITGRATEHYVTAAMQFGIENERYAVAAYEMAHDVEAEKSGFFVHEMIDRAGASPDRKIGEDTLLETKCPTSATHLNYLMGGVVPEDYIPQMTWQLACTGRKRCVFVSYDPRVPDEFAYFEATLERDEKAIAEMEAEVRKFLGELGEMVLKLRERENRNPVHVERDADDPRCVPVSGVPSSVIPDAGEWIRS